MIITDIIKEKKHLCRVVFDCGREELLDIDTVSVSCLHKQDSITEEKLTEIIAESNYNRAKNRALWYLDRRAYTEKELYNKLLQKGFERKALARVVARFVELGLLDDRRFAENYLEQLYGANTSKREVYHKMINKGIPKSLIDELLESQEVDEGAQIREIINKKYRFKLEAQENVKKVYAALVRKGFSYSAVRRELYSYSEEIKNKEFSEEF